MKLLRTPDERYKGLRDYPFKPNYVEVEGVRIHYIDEGRNTHETVLMIHGEPTWSYLYRKMIPVVVGAEYRVIVPDLVGFGKSDKPSEMRDYSYQKHVNWMTGLIKLLDLRNITLICQDWGGLIGLRRLLTMKNDLNGYASQTPVCQPEKGSHQRLFSSGGNILKKHRYSSYWGNRK